MVSFVHKERRDTSGSIRCIVVGKFGKGYQLGPIVLLVVAVDSKVLFQGLVDTFGLSIAFGVISKVKCNFMSKALPRDLKKCEMNLEPQSEVT